MTRRLRWRSPVALASADDIWVVQMIDPNGDARGRPDAVYAQPDPDAFGIGLAIDSDRIVTWACAAFA